MKVEIFIQDGFLGPEYQTVTVRNHREYRVRQLRALARLGRSYDSYVRDMWLRYPEIMADLFADQNQAVSFVRNNRKQLRV